MTNWKAPANVAHVNVDQQIDFCEGGNLAVNGGNGIVATINELQKSFAVNVKTQDFHPAGHSSFASANPGKNPFETVETSYGTQVLWPDHCVQGTKGAAFHPDLTINANDLIIQKGTNPAIDSYSAFFENDRVTQPRFSDAQTFTEKMRGLGITKLVFTGLAFDYCVGWNALDAVQEGFEAIVVEDATRSISPATEQAMRERLIAAGVKIVAAADLPRALGIAPKPSFSAPAP